MLLPFKEGMKSPGKCFLCGVLVLASPAIAEYYDWVNRFGGNDSSGSAIGLDAAGNVYVAGTFKGSLTIGTNHFMSAGGADVFVAKLTSNGEPVWALAVGGPDNDAVTGMAVAGDGAAFICGNFAISRTRVSNPPPGSGAFVSAVVARIDNGSFSWIDSNTNGNGGGITIQQGSESVWLFGTRGFERFIRTFNFDGDVLADFPVAETLMGTPNDIAVSSNGCIYVSGHKGMAALTPDGQLIWTWHPPGANTAKIAAITLASDDLLFSSGEMGGATGSGPYPYAFVASHEASGKLRWLSTIGEHRGFMRATDVIVDHSGTVLMSGGGSEYYFSRKSRTVVLLGVFDRDGEKLFEDRIRSVERSDENGGGGIACDQNGNTFFTGFLRGIPKFGTNVMGGGLSDIPNAFVARRLTLQPRFTIQPHETNIVLSWPRPGMPFALQQKSGASSNTWSDVPDAPVEIENRKQVTVALGDAHCLFRLRMTNEEPIRPRRFQLGRPARARVSAQIDRGL